ncbi:MAG TPA: hypothetical protein PKD72_09590 [Gemmatales bacterium]|nr:hypothetical protein [Gemmatales bacterium]
MVLALSQRPTGEVHAQTRPGEKPSIPLRYGYYDVSPEGPRDGGDFGSYTPGTKTSGIQEAFDACKRDRRDLYITGGAAPEAFKNPGGVYALEETVRIPWMQDFRCDSGEAVLQYTRPNGDAIVMDSQMSCVYKFGLIALLEGKADGACLRIKPITAGQDRLVGVVTCRFAINALVGGPAVWKKRSSSRGAMDWSSTQLRAALIVTIFSSMKFWVATVACT